ncbi:MAG: SDR family oxidoreductase [Gemmatimonadetes bacterium]|nr:SDR family oxidoreductase [Gemmatimonadota bacterium]MBT6150267.1 SDR family oxidoreductase [Gemmatimonadota bacterium]MBT7859837.1 SDR family oxidoreductase [Gemmatimonadota bacterium]
MALVTGGKRRIGRGIALTLAAAGYDVVINDLAHDEDADETVRQIQALGRRSHFHEADISDAAQVEAMVEQTCAQMGATINVLVNNPFWADHKPFLEIEEADWDRTMDVCLKGFFLCSQAVARKMVDSGGGTIVSISSIHAQAVWSGDTVYGVAKEAILRLTRSMAVELGRHGIRANVILPGYMDTEHVFGTEPPSAKVVDHPSRGFTPTFRSSTPEDIGRAVVFLASAGGANINGVALPVDGGFLAT